MTAKILLKLIYCLNLVLGVMLSTAQASSVTLEDQTPKPTTLNITMGGLYLPVEIVGEFCEQIPDPLSLISFKRVSKDLNRAIKAMDRFYLPADEAKRKELQLRVLVGEDSFSSLFKRAMNSTNGLQWLAAYPGFFACHFKSLYPFNGQNPDQSVLDIYTRAFREAMPKELAEVFTTDSLKKELNKENDLELIHHIMRLGGNDATRESFLKFHNMVSGLKLLLTIAPPNSLSPRTGLQLLFAKYKRHEHIYYKATMNLIRGLHEDTDPAFPPCRYLYEMKVINFRKDHIPEVLPPLFFTFTHFLEDTSILPSHRLGICYAVLRIFPQSNPDYLDPRIRQLFNNGILRTLQQVKDHPDLSEDYQAYIDAFLAQKPKDVFAFSTQLISLAKENLQTEITWSPSWRIEGWQPTLSNGI